MTRRRRRISVSLAMLTFVASAWCAHRFLQGGGVELGGDLFVVKPYLQIGHERPSSGPKLDRLELLWQTRDHPNPERIAWMVDTRADEHAPWKPVGAPTARRVGVEGIPALRTYRAAMTNLPPGQSFEYRIRRSGEVVFQARGSTPRPAGQPQRFVVFGDCAADTPDQRAVAYQTYQARPDYVVITGDIVYPRGRVSEYLNHFFPVYNNEAATPEQGAPLLRSTVFLATPGNHDLIERDLDRIPDGLAYFYYWSQPLNGPELAADSPSGPRLSGSEANRQAFLEGAGPTYPRMTNFSIDLGDIHWVMLDSNPYMDWTDPALRGWLEADLAGAAGAAWRVVAFHHPPFHSSKAHSEDQRMRVLAPVFEKGGVSVVFGGHVHNYERSRPLRFVADPPPPGSGSKPYGSGGQVAGKWTLDTTFDGAEHNRPDGVVYLVTGAGGARLYDPNQNDDPASWKDFTARFVSVIHSLTIVDATPDVLKFQQVSDEGREVDRFVIHR